ncbi:MAG: glycoside hydrolase family 88 protein [Clostridia bacterium]|nr:glycoside hydrolase family 88 protein [Clostridia bacterium]
MINISTEDKRYFEKVFEKIDVKMQKVAVRSFNKIPYTAKNGIHDDKNLVDIEWWTNGFWPGLMWMMYVQTHNEQYKKTAINAEDLLRRALHTNISGISHDVGFMYDISTGVHYRLTGERQAQADTMLAANLLAGRFNIKGNYIRAWNNRKGAPDKSGWAIIDCMMNLPLLYRMSEIVDDERYTNIAKAHADKTMQYHIREDGSVKHIVSYDRHTGDLIEDFGGQGYGLGSSWSRGQAWALYGFVLSYIHTNDKKYLDTAKKVANYFISCLSEEKDYLPLCDFRAPKEPVIYDSTAGACAACGLIEIANCAGEYEKSLYLNAAIKLLKAMTEKFTDFSEDTDPVLLYGTESYHTENPHIPIIYGDYFYIEAIYKLINEKKDDMLFW